MRWGTEGFTGKNNEKTRNIAKNHSSGRQRSDVSQSVFGRAEVTRLEQGDTGQDGVPPQRPAPCGRTFLGAAARLAVSSVVATGQGRPPPNLPRGSSSFTQGLGLWEAANHSHSRDDASVSEPSWFRFSEDIFAL